MVRWWTIILRAWHLTQQEVDFWKISCKYFRDPTRVILPLFKHRWRMADPVLHCFPHTALSRRELRSECWMTTEVRQFVKKEKTYFIENSHPDATLSFILARINFLMILVFLSSTRQPLKAINECLTLQWALNCGFYIPFLLNITLQFFDVNFCLLFCKCYPALSVQISVKIFLHLTSGFRF